jgi:hypothetical protein
VEYGQVVRLQPVVRVYSARRALIADALGISPATSSRARRRRSLAAISAAVLTRIAHGDQARAGGVGMLAG